MDTLEVYWSMLEAGVGLMAVNLPSLWAYVNKISPERVLASIRSVISLSSLRSTGTSRSHTGTTGHQQLDGESIASKSSRRDFLRAENVEAHAMHDVESQKNH